MRKIDSHSIINTNTPKGPFRGYSLLTQQNLLSNISKYLRSQQFYEVQLGQVIKVLTQVNVGEPYYEVHQPGAILCRLLYTQTDQRQQNLKVMIPRNSSCFTIPVVGQIVLCSEHPSIAADPKDGMIFDQYYYFGILNILNSRNNNSFIGISYPNQQDKQEQQATQDQKVIDQTFIVDNNIQTPQYTQGDVIISGRYNNHIKLSHDNIDENYNQNIIINNGNSQIKLINNKVDVDPLQVSSDDQYGQKNLKGSNIIIQSDRLLVNSIISNTQLYSKVNLVLSSNENIFVTSNNVNIQAQEVIIKVGQNSITVNSSGVKIDAPKIELNGATTINGIQDGTTPGFCSIPVCPFTGAPHTTKTVGVSS